MSTRRYAVSCVPPSTEKGRGAWYEIVAAVGAAVDNRRGIDVTSVNEGANIARSIVTIITAGNWPIVVYARVKYRFFDDSIR